MIKLDVKPLISVGEVEFGMPREKVRQLFGAYSEFRKTPNSAKTTDAFSFCHVFYDVNDCCEAIEIFDAEVFINRQKVFPCSTSEIESLLPNFSEEYGSYLDIDRSIGIYAPDDQAESILFGCNGYYR